MCGIYGFVGPAVEPAAEDVLDAMDRSIVHRGPDDSGTFVDTFPGGRCAFGMRRLSIIDLGGGRQPIHDEARRVWVVFNGELYNHRELRRELEARGHCFYTSSDTEVIVHLYEDRGEDFVHALDGMFGIALWDRASSSLLLARDRLGIKPLHYAQVGSTLVFGSELKSLLHHPQIARTVSPAALSHYLSFGSTPNDQSILDGVKKLPPGHLLRWRGGRSRVRRYWDLRLAPRAPISFESAAEEVRGHIRRAVRSHLVADVPVGAFLSGGIDSATIVGTMAELGVHPKTFSIGFDEEEFDELRYARMVARKLGTDHHELVVRPDAWELVEKLPWFLDEPFADVSAIPTYLVSQLAATQVKVVLSGDGGDEVFAGYERYAQSLALEARLAFVPAPVRALLRMAARLAPRATPGKHWMHLASQPRRLRFIEAESLFPSDLKRELVTPELLRAADPLEDRARLLERAPGDALSRLLSFDTQTYLPLDILTKVDRMSMAHSLETRPPLLDHKLVEAVFTLPSSFKLRRDGGTVTQKAILRQAVRGLVPDEILRRPKRGFGVPIRHWFRGTLRDAVIDVITSERARSRGWLRDGFVRALCEEHLSGRRDQSVRMWALLMLEKWCQQFLDVPLAQPARVAERAHG